MLILEVLIERKVESLNRPFSYVYSGNNYVDKGYRVLVPFNHKNVVGYVIAKKEYIGNVEQLENQTGYKIQEIISIIDGRPLLNDDLILLADKVADFYLAPKISVLQTMLPTSLKPSTSSLKAPKIAYNKYISIIDDGEENLTPKQVELLRKIKESGLVLKSDIKAKSVLKKLLDLGKVHIVEIEKRRLNIEKYSKNVIKELTIEQKNAFDSIINTDKMVTLLHGVTGSGKTEIYFSLANFYLAQNKSVLILVPEISLTPHMMNYFLSSFKEKSAILHSELTPAEKYDEYRRIANGDCQIVIGTRSAIFAPLSNIGLIILDEEHVESYKQDSLPFYNAKEVAMMRAEMHGAKVVLGSATPSLESRARALKGNYNYVLLNKRINNQELPKTRIIDLSNTNNLSRDSYIFSKQLIDSLKKVLEKKEQAILLINRRGYSGNITCRSCGHIFKCPNCDIPLTYHKNNELLKCHHCGHVEFVPKECPKCGSRFFSKSGFGTERIVDEINKLFPEARVLRLDADVGEVRKNISNTIRSFLNYEADILVGTQMIAKGHDFPNVTLVGVVLADLGLSLPSYRATEVTFELITQAIGRSGRGNKIGEAIIQTYNPFHYAIIYAAKQDYESFFKKEMTYRKIQGYPPYMYLATIEISSNNEEILLKSSDIIAEQINNENFNDVVVLGPVEPYFYKENGNYKRVILVKYKNSDKIKPYLKELLENTKINSKYNVKININPFNV